MLASVVVQAICESILIIQPHACMLDKKRGITFVGVMICSLYSKCNALVICNHGPPTPGAGRGIAVEMSGVFTFALSPQCGGNTRDLCYIGKNGGAMKT